MKCLRYEKAIRRKWEDICVVIFFSTSRQTILLHLHQISLKRCKPSVHIICMKLRLESFSNKKNWKSKFKITILVGLGKNWIRDNFRMHYIIQIQVLVAGATSFKMFKLNLLLNRLPASFSLPFASRTKIKKKTVTRCFAIKPLLLFHSLPLLFHSLFPFS